jgi:hypothetical protein
LKRLTYSLHEDWAQIYTNHATTVSHDYHELPNSHALSRSLAMQTGHRFAYSKHDYARHLGGGGGHVTTGMEQILRKGKNTKARTAKDARQAALQRRVKELRERAKAADTLREGT